MSENTRLTVAMFLIVGMCLALVAHAINSDHRAVPPHGVVGKCANGSACQTFAAILRDGGLVSEGPLTARK